MNLTRFFSLHYSSFYHLVIIFFFRLVELLSFFKNNTTSLWKLNYPLQDVKVKIKNKNVNFGKQIISWLFANLRYFRYIKIEITKITAIFLYTDYFDQWFLFLLFLNRLLLQVINDWTLPFCLINLISAIPEIIIEDFWMVFREIWHLWK